MQELIKMLQTKAGITEEQAVKSVETIKEFIQSKLPPMMHGLVDNFMGSMGNEDEDDILDGGNNDDSSEWKDKARKVTDEATEKLEDFKDDAEEFAKEATEKIGLWADKAEKAADDAIGKLKDMLQKKEENQKN